MARYIVLNPVRAGMVQDPADWPWSSYRATSGMCSPPTWLDSDVILAQLHPKDREQACRFYRVFVRDAVGQTESPWDGLVAQTFLGSPDFLQKVEEKVRARTFDEDHAAEVREFTMMEAGQVRACVERVVGRSIDRMTADTKAGRQAFALIARNDCRTGLREIGTHLGIGSSAAEYLIQKAECRMNSETAFAWLVETVRARLKNCNFKM